MRWIPKDKLADFKKYWFYFIIQSAFVVLTLFVALFALTIEKQPIIIASIGATAFIVFAMPKSVTAKPRNAIGGHLVGLPSGYLCSLIPHASLFFSMLVYSLTVGLSILVMVVTDTEHPPASGTALSVAAIGISVKVVIFILTTTIIISMIRLLLKRKLENLV